MLYRRPSWKTLLGVTKAKRHVKRATGITAVQRLFRAPKNFERRMGYYSEPMKFLRFLGKPVQVGITMALLAQILLVIIAFFFAACTVFTAAPPPPTLQPVQVDLEPAIQGGLRFLRGQYNPDLGLLRESTQVAYHRHWLATDNRLAIYALSAANDGLADRLQQRMADFQVPPHGLIEALVGQDVAWPPRTETQTKIAVYGTDEIWHEHRQTGSRYEDWPQYADLALYAALDAYNQNHLELAHQRYMQAMNLFDGVGFADKAHGASGLYATYKLALALYVGAKLQQPPDHRLLEALLARQDSSGGFITLYNAQGSQGDANTETASYALLALTALRQPLR
ncbi:hypothetical protein [Caldilinea sp.]|uniref:hypothetical protein n=1 Tax=Caldilinea sp. TaxID=2293560 RepID=UPI0021DDD20D|nr:hypothetical protein [Caldilinea sp.]GIV73529.1 MAG: hypothetical protein KatS3mg049_2085 [Caldilinea sp.]